jgi:hypothetical protein
VVRFGDGIEVAAHAVIIATGVSYRDLDAPGVSELSGSGLFYGSAATEASDCVDADVYIVGGANSAGQAAVFFSRVAKSVTLVVRADSLEVSMSQYLIEQLQSIDNVTLRLCTVVAEAHGDGHLEALTLQHVVSGASERVDTGHAFVFIGAQPRTEWLDGTLLRDERGFLLTGPDLVVDGQRTARLAAGPRPVAAGGEHPRRVRRWGRPRRLGQAGRLCRRRGCDGRDSRPPLPGSTMTVTAEPTGERLTNDELRSLFLFEALTDDQLSWFGERGWVVSMPAGATVLDEGDPPS